MRYIRRLLPVLFILLLAGGACTEKAPVTEPPRDARGKTGDNLAKDAKELAGEAQFESANYYLGKAIDIYKKVKEWEKAIHCHIRLGDNYQQLEEFDNARLELNAALDLTRNRLGYKHLELAKSFQKLGYQYLGNGEHNKALEMYEKALTIQLEILGPDHPEVAKTYNSISLSYWNKGDTQLAHKNYNHSFAIKLKQFQGVEFNVREKFKTLDRSEVRKGNFSRARNYFNQSLAVYKESFGTNDPLFATIYENIGILFTFEGEYDRALEHLRRAFKLRLDVFGDDTPEAAPSYHNIGICLRMKKDYTQAQHFLERALELYKQNPEAASHTDTADIYYQLGQIQYEEFNADKALSYYQKALVEIAPGFQEGSIYKNPVLEKSASRDTFLKIMAAKADALKVRYFKDTTRTRDLQFSFETYQLAVKLVENIRRGYKSESYKLFFGEKSHQIYDEAIQAAMMLYDMTGMNSYMKQAFVLSEQSKASVLGEALAESRARRFAGLPAELLEKESKLKDELDFYDMLLEKEYRVQIDDPKRKERIANLEDHYYNLKKEYRALVVRFEKNYPRYYDLKYNPNPVSVAAIQQALPKDAALLEYFMGEYFINIFVLTPHSLEAISLPLLEDFSETVDTFYLAIKKIEVQTFLQYSREMHQRLIDPVRDALRGKRKLIIIPHGKLFYVPFEALSSGRSRPGNLPAVNYLIKRFAVNYHYSAQLWLDTGALSGENSFIGFAPVFTDNRAGAQPMRDVEVEGKRFPALPGTEEEVRSIIRLFKGKNKNASGFFHANASETQFKSPFMKDYSIIHVATHSINEEDNPKLSGLIFSREQGTGPADDGILYSGETYNLDLDADLIVLSSCETGIGKLVKGEGMVALNRGFLYSGVRNTVFSLWKVEDKTTSHLMIELYKKILAGKSYSRALREAKLELIKDPYTAFPRYWSGFILVGK